MLDTSPTRSLDETLRRAGQQLAETRPELERVLLRARDRYVRTYVWTRTLSNRMRYDAPPDPYRMVSVDPSDVEHTAEFRAPKFRRAGRVAGGDWDQSVERFEDYDVYRAYEAHFEDGVPWAETEFFDRVVGEIESGVEQWGCTSRAEFEDRCVRLDELYETIAADGYYTQEQLLASETDDPIEPQNVLKTERLKDEIAVHVARDGELLFEDGRNRLSIVKLLDLDSVPVRVLCRHERWQELRDAYVNGDPAAVDYGDHPDLAALEFGAEA